MAKFTTKIIDNKKQWESFVLSQKPQSFLQSFNWGEINKQTGEKVIRLGIYQQQEFCTTKLVGICLMVKQMAKRGPHFLIPAGPLLDWDDKQLVDYFVKKIYKIAKKEKVWFIRIRPEILDNSKNRLMFRKLGLIPAPTHLHAENTWVLDITQSEEQLLAQMRKTTRYLVRKSLRDELDIKISKDPKESRILFNLQRETALRHNFVGFSQKLFEKEIEILGKDDQAVVFTIKKDEISLAVAIIVFYGDVAYYHFSGSTSKYSKSPFSYRLQWEVIKYAKNRGVKRYNFWGIAPNDNPKHRFAGVTLFKKGFGGERVDWLHAHDLVINPLYFLTYAFEMVRKTIRRL